MLGVSEIEQLRLLCGMRVRFLRKQQDLTQEQLAGRLHMERSRLSRVERGARPATFDELALIVDEFDLSLSDFFAGIVLPPNLERYVITRDVRVNESETGWSRF